MRPGCGTACIENEKRWNLKLLHQTGVLWMVTAGDDHFERESLPALRDAGIAYQKLPIQEMATRWPQFNLEGVHWGIYEPEGGFLTARVACQAVLDGFLAEGGEYRPAAVVSRELDGKWDSLSLSDGSKLEADQYVFACGPWLGKLFPETVGDHIRPTKQDVFFFGAPAGDDRFTEARLPVWADHRDRFHLRHSRQSREEGSKSPTIRADRNSIRPRENEPSAPKD